VSVFFKRNCVEPNCRKHCFSRTISKNPASLFLLSDVVKNIVEKQCELWNWLQIDYKSIFWFKTNLNYGSCDAPVDSSSRNRCQTWNGFAKLLGKYRMCVDSGSVVVRNTGGTEVEVCIWKNPCPTVKMNITTEVSKQTFRSWRDLCLNRQNFLNQCFPKWAVRNSRGAVKQKWAIRGRWSRNGWLGGDRRPS